MKMERNKCLFTITLCSFLAISFIPQKSCELGKFDAEVEWEPKVELEEESEGGSEEATEGMLEGNTEGKV